MLALCASVDQTQCPIHHAHQSHLSIGGSTPSPNPKILAGGHAMSVTQTLRYASTTILTDSPTGTGGNQKDGDDVRDPLTNPATSRIVKVTIACAIVVLGITGLITGFKIAGLYRSHRETRRRRAIQATIATGGQVPGWMTQETKKKWGGRKVKNAHKQVEWEGIAA